MVWYKSKNSFGAYEVIILLAIIIKLSAVWVSIGLSHTAGRPVSMIRLNGTLTVSIFVGLTTCSKVQAGRKGTIFYMYFDTEKYSWFWNIFLCFFLFALIILIPTVWEVAEKWDWTSKCLKIPLNGNHCNKKSLDQIIRFSGKFLFGSPKSPSAIFL